MERHYGTYSGASGRNLNAPSADSDFFGFPVRRTNQMRRLVIAFGQMEPIWLQLGIKSNIEQFKNAIISVCV